MKLQYMIALFLVFSISSISAETFGYGRTEIIPDTSTTYYPNSILAVIGTPTGTNVTYIKYYDDLQINISETTGSPAIDYRINFTGVSSFNNVLMRIQYDEFATMHDLFMQIYNYDTDTWDLHSDIGDQNNLVEINQYVSDSENHVQNGIVQLRFYHVDNGNTNDKLIIDYVQLLKGTTAITTNDHDSMSNRNSETNHPWAVPKATIGTYETDPLWTANSTNVLYNNTNGNYNVSINTNLPITTTATTSTGGLDVYNDGGSFVYPIYLTSSSNLGVISGIVGRSSRGSKASPSTTISQDYLFALSGRGYITGTGWTTGSSSSMTIQAANTWTSTSQGSFITFGTTQTGTTTRKDRLTISHTGNIILPEDNQKLFFGTGNDATISYDGTNLVFNTNSTGTGDAWFSKDISATGYITRTEVFDKSTGSALDKIKDASELKDAEGNIKHEEFYGYVTYNVTDYSKPEKVLVVGKQCESEGVCFNVSTMETIYPHKKLEEGVNIVSEIELLRQALSEQKQINQELELRLSKLEATK